MITREQHLLVCLAEECAEVQKEVAKILRFGMIKEGDKPNVTLKGKEVPPNYETLKQEIVDLVAIIDMLEDYDITDFENQDGDKMEEAIETKKQKVEDYMRYAHELGQLEIK